MSFGHSPVFLLLCLLGAAALTYWTYRRTQPEVGSLTKGVLMGLRFVALFVILFLLFEPVWQQLHRDPQRPVIALLVDSSQSLGLQSDGESPLDLATDTRDLLRNLPLDRLDADAQIYTFDAQSRRYNAPLDSVAFEGVRTDIASAMDYVRDDLKDRNLRGVILVSDGRYNTGRNPIYTAERYPVPVYSIVVGDTTRRRDVQIRRATTNEIAYLNTEVPVEVSIAAEGYAGQQATVTLQHDNERLDTQSVTLGSGGTESVVTLAYRPQQVGLQRLVIAVTRFDGEVTYANNATAVTVQVLENKKKVTVIAGAPSPDLSSLVQVLGEDQNVEVTTFTQKSAGQFYEGPLPTTFSDTDVLILAGYPGRASDGATVRRLAEAASALPTFFVLDRQTNLALLRDAFAQILPAVPDAVRPGYVEAAPVPTPAGLSHPVLNVENVPETDWPRLPPLLVNESRWQVAPDARVLATIQIRGISLDDPLLVAQSRAGRRTAALLGAGTWRWQTLPEDLERLEPVWPGLLTNLLQWLGTREDDRRVRVRPVRDLFGGGEPGQLNGQVYDESLNPVDQASLEVTITAPDGNTFPFTMQGLGNGRYTLDAGTLPEGTYRYDAEATKDGKSLGTDTGAFAVGALTLEFRETTADASLMRQLARRSGGAFFTAADIAALTDSLRASGSLAPTVVEREEETPLWHLFAFFPLILTLLTAEWVVRKRSGMV